jgi:molybdopterin converting factor small subunit
MQPLTVPCDLADDAPRLKIGVQLFAAAAEWAGERQVQLTVPPQATVADLRQRLVAACPSLAQLTQLSRWAVNCEFVDDDYVFTHDQIVAMIPPVSGG